MTIRGSGRFTPFPPGCCAAKRTRLGLPRDFKIYDADDQTAVVKLALEQINIKDPGEKIRGLLERISFAKNHALTPAQVASDAARRNDALGHHRVEGLRDLRENSAQSRRARF